ncbi:hypothetical protein BGZ80_009730 [Entomortierella chlamydospora]|uniref:PROP1-like PPR domain-containing protein n=1 Tax=Entomortierella chlamydospora TaxID=101097 RepID=A0A9P6MVX6_9FUNG|nr:hypothetical protein BGZ80_009730 [Entomortierella chlamydospora]
MSCSSSRAANVLSVAMGIPSRSKSGMAGLSRRKFGKKASGATPNGSIHTKSQTHDLSSDYFQRSSRQFDVATAMSSQVAPAPVTRIQHSDGSWEIFFTHSCSPGSRRSRSLVTTHQTYARNRQCVPHRSFSIMACADGSTGATYEGARQCSQKGALNQQSLFTSPPCIVVDNAHRGRKSTVKAHQHSRNLPPKPISYPLESETLGLQNPTLRLSSTASGIASRDMSSHSIWSRHSKPSGHSISKRLLHSTRRRNSSFSRESNNGIGLSLEERVEIIAELRQKALVRASVPQLWAAYTEVVKNEALIQLKSADVVVLYQVLARSSQVEEATEMMLQVALDVNDIGKQLPQEAFDILMSQSVDNLPAEQMKAMLWQIQGRRRFITEFMQMCDSNAEMKRFLGLYNKLLKASFDVDISSVYYQSRKERADSLCELVLEWLKDEGRAVNPKVAEGLLIYLLDRGVLDKVYTFIGKLSKEGFNFTHGFYTTAIHRFGIGGKFDYVDLTLSFMRNQGLEPLEDTYSAIIDIHSKAGNLREAQRAYQDILAADLVPTDKSLGPMLEAVGKMGDYDMTRQLVDQMNSSGVPSNEYTFSALLQSLSQDPEKSVNLFEELSKQIEPNTVNFNMLIRTFQRHGDLDGAFRVFRSMIADGVKPDQYTFSSILSLFASRGDAEGAEVFWNEMINTHKVVPNAHAYGSMMHVYCTTEDMLSAQTVYREMIQAGILPNEVIFGTLLNAYARRGDLTQMLSIYDAMRAEGLKPNSYIYSNLLFGLVKDGDMGAARRLFENMEEDGFGNNVLAQTILMKGYLDQGNFKESQEVYKNMLRSGLIPNFMTYATLLQAHARRGETKKAEAFLNKIMASRGLVVVGSEDEEVDGDEMTKLGIHQSQDRAEPTSVDELGKDSSSTGFQEGHLSSLGTERKPLKISAKPKPLMAFTPLLDAYAKESDMLAASKMFEEIKSRGLQPNTITYTILMDGYRRAGDVDSVLRIWGELFDRFQQQRKDILEHPDNYRPSKSPVVEWVQDRLSTKGFKLQRLMQRPVSIMLDSLCYSGRVQEAKDMWSQLEHLGFEFDSSNWNDYCIALARNGFLLDACHIVQDKLLRGVEIERESSQAEGESPNMWPRTVRAKSTKLNAARNYQSLSSKGDSLESIPEDTVPKKQPATLFFPRPRTFAALADSFEELLAPKKDKGVRYQDYLANPIMSSPLSTPSVAEDAGADLKSKRLEKRKRLIEAKLLSYPHPFDNLDENHRQILWNLVRAEYPRVIEALGEGILVASNRSVNTVPSLLSVDSGFKGTRTKEESGSDDAPSTDNKRPVFGNFRQWRRLKSVMKDMERKQFLEDRKGFIQERENRFALLRNRKPI